MMFEMFLIVCLAIWRLTSLFYVEEGPFKMFDKVREFFNDSPAFDMFDCFWCLSLWVALPFAWYMTEGLLAFFIYWLAFSAVAIIINVVIEKVEQP